MSPDAPDDVASRLRPVATELDELRGAIKAGIYQLLNDRTVLQRADPLELAAVLDGWADRIVDVAQVVNEVRFSPSVSSPDQGRLPMEY